MFQARVARHGSPGAPGSPGPQGRTSLLRGEGGEVRTMEALATGGPPAWRASVRRAGGASGEERAHRAFHESVGRRRRAGRRSERPAVQAGPQARPAGVPVPAATCES